MYSADIFNSPVLIVLTKSQMDPTASFVDVGIMSERSRNAWIGAETEFTNSRAMLNSQCSLNKVLNFLVYTLEVYRPAALNRHGQLVILKPTIAFSYLVQVHCEIGDEHPVHRGRKC